MSEIAGHNGVVIFYPESIVNSYVKNGYAYVCLCVCNHKRGCRVHRLVAEAFLKNDDPQHKTLVHHKDGNRLNNNVDNLAYVTYLENNNARIPQGGCKAVVVEGKLYKSIRQAADATKIIYQELCAWLSDKAVIPPKYMSMGIHYATENEIATMGGVSE